MHHHMVAEKGHSILGDKYTSIVPIATYIAAVHAMLSFNSRDCACAYTLTATG